MNKHINYSLFALLVLGSAVSCVAMDWMSMDPLAMEQEMKARAQAGANRGNVSDILLLGEIYFSGRTDMPNYDAASRYLAQVVNNSRATAAQQTRAQALINEIFASYRRRIDNPSSEADKEVAQRYLRELQSRLGINVEELE